MNGKAFQKQLIEHEGMQLQMYVDSVGIPTIGVGHNLRMPLTEDAVMQILSDDIGDVILDLSVNLPWWLTLDEIRQRVLADMCFNLGIARLLGFKNMLAALEVDNYDKAADEMKDSKWYVQVGSRGVRLEEMMRTGLEVVWS